MTRYSIESLNEFATGLFRAAGLPEEDARVSAYAFIITEVRGVKTHGLRRLRSRVLEVSGGSLNRNPKRRVLRESGAIVVIDNDSGIGVVGCMDAMERAIALSKQYGIGFAVVVNSNHFVAAAPYVMRAAEAGVIGIALANGQSSMAYPGTNVGALGNSPLGYAIPTDAGFPIVFDAALTISGGKMTELERLGESVPDGFLGYNAAGEYTTNPAEMHRGGVGLPIGLHKGGGIAVMMDVLTSVIGGTGFLRTLIPEGQDELRWTRNTHSFIAIDIGHLMPLGDFKDRMKSYVADLKAKPLAPGYDEIVLPGERAARTIADRETNGVPIEEDVLKDLTELSLQFDIPLPGAL